MSSKNEFQHHIHVFRGVAILLIVCAHTVPSLNWSNNPLLGRVIDGVANESSIFFFFIAGYLFQHLSYRFSFSSYLKQKLKTVIVPYLLLSIPALFIFTVLVQREGMWSWFYLQPLWAQVGLFLITGKHLAPLWFVPTIALFYLCAPLFLVIDRKYQRLYWLIVPFLILSIYLGRDGPYGPLNKAVYLLPIYMLGMVFSRYRENAEALIKRFWAVLLLITLVGFYGFVADWTDPPHYLMVMKVPMTFLLVLLLLKTHNIIGKRLNYVAHVSFGIFFIHAYFISALKVAAVYLAGEGIYTGVGGDVIPGNIFVFVAYVAVVTVVTVTTIWLGQKVFGRYSRSIIGA